MLNQSDLIAHHDLEELFQSLLSYKFFLNEMLPKSPIWARMVATNVIGTITSP